MTSNTDGAAQGEWHEAERREGNDFWLELVAPDGSKHSPSSYVSLLNQLDRKAQTADALAKALEALRAVHDGGPPYRTSAALRMADAALARHAATEEATRE